MPIHVVHPWVLLLLWAPLLFGAGALLAEAASERRLRRFAADPMLRRLSPPSNRRRTRLQLALAVAGLMLLIVACSRPQWGRREVEVRERSRNLMVLLDVSRSMLAQDAQPNRLERAKAELHDLADALDGDRIGLIAFRNGATLLCPLTRDYGFFKFALNGADLHSAPPGPTDIASGIRAALEALDSARDGHHALLVVSDGEDLQHDTQAAARKASERGIPIYSLAIGSPEGAPVPDGAGGWLTFEDERVVSRMTLDSLQHMAAMTGGFCISLGEAGALRGAPLGELYRRHLQSLAATEQSFGLAQRHVDRQAWFLVPGILLLLGAAALSPGRTRRITGRAAALIGCLLCATGSMAQAELNRFPDAAPASPGLHADGIRGGLDAIDPEPVDTPVPETPAEAMRLIRAAREHYQSTEYRQAAAAYLAAARVLDPRRAEACRFNAALSLARANDFAAAEEALVPLTGSVELGGQATRLLGEIRLAHAATLPGEALEDRIRLLEAAVNDFQQAIAILPPAPEISGALSAASSALRDSRRDARIAELLKLHGDTPAENLLLKMLENQRRIARQAAGSEQAKAPERIRESEAAATLQAETRDLLIPLKPALQDMARAREDHETAIRLEREIEFLRDHMDETARRLQDLDSGATGRAVETEASLFNLWQPLATPPGLVDMALAAQSNALFRPPPPHDDPRPWQSESEALARSFQERFPEWADAWNEHAEPEASLSHEDRAEIERLSERVLARQAQARRQLETGEPATETQSAALADLTRIRELLPRPPDPPPQPSAEPTESESEPDASDPANALDPIDSPDPPDPQPEEPVRADPPENPDFERLLEQALRREHEHADEQRRQAREQPPQPGVSDW